MFTLMRTWWSRPFDFDAMPDYMAQRGLRTQYRALMMTIVLVVVAAGALLTITTESSRGSVLATTTIGAVSSLIWLRRPWPTRRMSLAFVFGNDVSLLFTIGVVAEPNVTFSFTLVFAMLAVYCGYFHSIRTLALHAALTMLGALFFFATSLRGGGDAVLLAAQLLMQFTLFVMSPLLAQVPLTFLRDDAYTSSTDPLTGALNRRGLDASVTSEVFAAMRPTDAVALMVIDLDRFKTVNDMLGHAGGDTALELVSARLMRAASGWAEVARLGGEEFCVVGVSPEIDMCARYRAVHAVVRDGSDPMPLGASAGVAWISGTQWRPDSELVHQLIRRADRLMYDAKRAGGDRVWFDDRQV